MRRTSVKKFLGVTALWAALGSCAVGAVSLPIPTPVAAHPNALGINIDPPKDWSGNRLFADVMKTARDWSRLQSDPGAGDAAVDAQGWPTEDAQCVLWANTQMHGTYKLSFTGKATVTTDWAPASLQNVSYQAATNTTTADLVFRSDGQNNFLIRFTRTAGGVKNVKLMRPLAPGSAKSYPPTALFTDQFKRAVAPFASIRYKDFTATDQNQNAGRWIDRVQPTAASFNREGKGYGWQGRGAAWEYVILLANELKKDAWISLPIRADDDYVRNLAALFRNGNPAARVPPLDPGLKLYVEYSNEVWNHQFEQAKYNYDRAQAEHAAGDRARYDYDGSKNDWYFAWRRWLRRTADFSLIFRAVFGDAQMMTRIRPVYCWQQGAGQNTGMDPLKYLETAYIPLVAPGKPVNYLLYGGGGSAYYSPNTDTDALTLDSIWSNEAMDVNRWRLTQEKDHNIAAAFGLVYVAYEGGPGFDKSGHAEAVKAKAVKDPRMREAILAHHQAWGLWNGDLLTYFTLTGDYQWGFTDDVVNVDTPKLAAVRALAAGSRNRLGVGKAAPAVRDGRDFDLGFHPWYKPGGGSQKVKGGEWYSYVFVAAQAGPHELVATVGGTPSDVGLMVDGVDLPPGTLARTVQLTAGAHAIRVKSKGEEISVKSVSLKPIAKAPSAPPASPPSPGG
ncbi:MAG: hypothetical protein ABUL77_00585 [Bacteroidota bacterium]